MKVDLFMAESARNRLKFSALRYPKDKAPYIYSVCGVVAGQRLVKHNTDLHELYHKVSALVDDDFRKILEDAYLDWQLRVPE